MSEPFIGEITMLSFNWAPRFWAKCDGQILAINQNQSLYSLLGNTYGGDGRNNFALPDLRSRVPIHVGTDYGIGQKGGMEMAQVHPDALPSHTHVLNALVDDAKKPAPKDTLLATSSSPIYSNSTDGLTQMSSTAVSKTGGGQYHDNMQPYQVVNFCIALQGLFPSRN